MARKKVAEQARHHQRQRRDVRRLGEGNVEEAPVASADQTPSRLASGRELLQKFRELLSDEERQIADLRAQAPTGPGSPPYWAEHPTDAASNWRARSPASSSSWGSIRCSTKGLRDRTSIHSVRLATPTAMRVAGMMEFVRRVIKLSMIGQLCDERLRQWRRLAI